MAVSTRPLHVAPRPADRPAVDVSVLVPAKDEAGNLALFLELCADMIRAQQASY